MDKLMRLINKPPRIFVDLDGTLNNEPEGFGDKVFMQKTPNIEAIRYLNHLSLQGARIVIWTKRPSSDRLITTDWLKKHKVMYNELIMDKPQFDIFFDDKVQNNTVLDKLAKEYCKEAEKKKAWEEKMNCGM